MKIGRLLDWHEDPWLVAQAATPVGQTVVWLAALVLLPGSFRIRILPFLAVAQLFPARRIDALAVGACFMLFARLPATAGNHGLLLKYASAAPVAAVLALSFRAAQAYPALPAIVRRRPVVFLHLAVLGTCGLTLGMAMAFGVMRESLLWPFVATTTSLLPWLLWRLSYLALSAKRGTVGQGDLRHHLYYLVPVWGGWMVPIGKGNDYLTQHRADGREAIAGAQLAGLKLLLLYWIWRAIRILLRSLVYGTPPAWFAEHVGTWSLRVPALEEAIAMGPTTLPLGTRWLTLLFGFFSVILTVTLLGHPVVGSLRLFGFRVFRNTYRPLLARSIVDFWGRYYYYFKEMLVEFFFYPTFVAAGGKSARLRMFLAVMAAAGLGNLYYHLVQDARYYVGAGGLSRLICRMTYTVLLTLGIWLSMVREQERRRRPGPVPGPATAWGSLRASGAILGVWLFYGLIHVWNVEPSLGFAVRARFMLGLIGL